LGCPVVVDEGGFQTTRIFLKNRRFTPCAVRDEEDKVVVRDEGDRVVARDEGDRVVARDKEDRVNPRLPELSASVSAPSVVRKKFMNKVFPVPKKNAPSVGLQ
jgi:hypothetical protein